MEEGNSYNQGTWAVKRISSTSGGGQAGVTMSSGYRAALTRDVSVPGESEVLWRHSDLKGPYSALFWIKKKIFTICRGGAAKFPNRSILLEKYNFGSRSTFFGPI